MKLLARGGEAFVILLQAFQPLLEIRVHIVAVYKPRVDFRDVPIELVGRVGGTVRGIASAGEELLVALYEGEIGSLIDDGLNEDGLAVLRTLFGFLLEFVGVLLPGKTLHLRGFKEFIELDKFFRELAPGFLRFGELGEVANVRGVEDHEYLL